MTLFIFSGILIGTISLLLEKKHGDICNKKLAIRIKYILVGLFLLFVVIVGMCANRMQADARAYNGFFSYVKIYGLNPWDYTYTLFSYITRIFVFVFPNLSVYEYRALICLTGWIIIIYGYSKYSTSLNSVLLLYLMSFLFAHDGAQIKNFLALSMVLSAISFYIGHSKCYLIKFYVIMGIAVLLHFSCFVYLFIPLVGTRWFKSNGKIFPVIGVAIYFIFYLIGVPITSFVLARITSIVPILSKAGVYSEYYSGKRSLVFVVIYFLSYFLLLQCRQSIYLLSEEKKSFFNQTFDIWNYMGAILPFLIYANAAYRLFRNLIILVFVCVTNSLLCYSRFSHRRLNFTLIALALVFSIILQPILFNSSVDVFFPIFSGNFFWK